MAARTRPHQSPGREADELAGVVLGLSDSTVCSESLGLYPSRAPDLHRGATPAVQTYEVLVKLQEQNQAMQRQFGAASTFARGSLS